MGSDTNHYTTHSTEPVKSCGSGVRAIQSNIVCDTYPHVEMLSNTNLIAPNAIFLCNFHISEKSPNTISLPSSVIMLAEKDIVNFLKEHDDITDMN